MHTLFSQDTRELAGIDICDRHNLLLFEIFGQSLRLPPITGGQGQIPDNQSCSIYSINFAGFDVIRIGARIADMRISKCDDLPAIRWISDNFLITGHGSVEHHFTRTYAFHTDGYATKNCAVSEREDGMRAL